jgi:hypothetical protein
LLQINIDEKGIIKLKQRPQIPISYAGYKVSAISLDHNYLCIAVAVDASKQDATHLPDILATQYPDILVWTKESLHGER